MKCIGRLFISGLQMSHDLYNALSAIESSSHYHEWIFSHFEHYIKSGDVVLDVGSGTGSIAHTFRRTPFKQFFLTDCDDIMISHLMTRFQGEDDRYRVEKLDIVHFNKKEHPSICAVNLVTCINVLEHIEEDFLALRNIHSILSMRGRFLLMVPALQSIYGTLDSLGGHCRRYDKKALNQLLTKSGFKIEKQHYMNFFGIFTWFLSGKILRQKKFDPAVLMKLDRCVPVLQAIEKIVKPPLGQSLIAISSKV